MNKHLEITELPADVLEKAEIVGNVFADLEKTTNKLKAIDEIVSSDWGYSVTDDMVDLPSGKYKVFTQKQAEEMADAIGRIYMIAHTIHCTGCDAGWKYQPLESATVAE